MSGRRQRQPESWRGREFPFDMTSEDVLRHVGGNLTSLRRERGLSVPELAEKADVPAREVSLLEAGLESVKSDTLVVLAHVLGVSPVRFFE